ncbi:MAG: class I SAM-dependent methyltransferase [Thermoplasmatota archaeon]
MDPGPLAKRLARQIRERGPMPFSEFMTEALYDPEHGYYARGPAIGASGDFYTAGSLAGFAFGLARAFAALWREVGTDELRLVELGAGTGELAEKLLAEFPEDSIRYTSVEPSRGLREQQAKRGLDVASDLGAIGAFEGVLFANEVIDALPVHRVEMRDGELHELWVALDARGAFIEERGPLSTPALAEYFEGVALAEGQRAEANLALGAFVRALGKSLTRGYALLIDYGDEEPTIYDATRRGGTLRTFSDHRVGSDVFERVGGEDITASVNFTRLAREAEAAGFRVAWRGTQSQFLLQNGALRFLEAAHARGDPLAGLGVKNLVVPGGMGEAFKVVVLAKGDVGNPVWGGP